MLHDYKCPYNIGLLEWAKENDYKIGLATMSHCKQANRVLEILQLKKYIDFIATRDD
ncbi:MAG: HAD hydrolase-like protein, partial [Nitrosopumilaceae archaeon]|nr:HAD hydrolase-like protein [Nitrosopumilaceae archaeon]NIX60600.1 HAD hydrolase-like protein [Nitrosopumilaceae archaeon]